MATYTCKYCGYQSNVPTSVVSNCRYSPHKHHEWMNATEKQSQYTCKYCGYQSNVPTSVVFNCNSSPHKTHEWMG